MPDMHDRGRSDRDRKKKCELCVDSVLVMDNNSLFKLGKETKSRRSTSLSQHFCAC